MGQRRMLYIRKEEWLKEKVSLMSKRKYPIMSPKREHQEETPDQRKTRLAAQRERARLRRSDWCQQRRVEEPPEQRETRLAAVKNYSFAKKLLYSEVPTYFTWNDNKKAFECRKRGESVNNQPNIFKETKIGRNYTIHSIKMNASFSACSWLLYPARRPLRFENCKADYT